MALSDFFMKKLNFDRQALPLLDLQTIERYCRMLKEDLSYSIDDGASSAEVSIPLLSSTRMTYTLSLTKEEFESICTATTRTRSGSGSWSCGKPESVTSRAGCATAWPRTRPS